MTNAACSSLAPLVAAGPPAAELLAVIPAERTADDRLLAEMSAGSEAAFLELHRRYHQRIYRFTLRMTGRREAAEEVVQEVFLAMLSNLHRFDANRAALSTYLLGIARKKILRLREKNLPCVPLDEQGEDLAPIHAHSFAANPLQELTQTEGLEKLRHAVASLPAHYREVVILCDLEELSYQDAARVLDCPLGTVRSRLSRAHAVLLQRLSRPAAGVAPDAHFPS